MGPYGVPGSLSMGSYGVPGSRDSWTRDLGSWDWLEHRIADKVILVFQEWFFFGFFLVFFGFSLVFFGTRFS